MISSTNLVCSDIEPSCGRTRTKDFFLTVRLVLTFNTRFPFLFTKPLRGWRVGSRSAYFVKLS